jgi:hypothetical protein
MVKLLAEGPKTRDGVLHTLAIGLRTFYRELELLHRCGVKIQLKHKLYTLLSTPAQAAGRLPFPDPQLSFAEMEELAQCPGEAGERLAALLDSVINQPLTKKKAGRSRRSAKRSENR